MEFDPFFEGVNSTHLTYHLNFVVSLLYGLLYRTRVLNFCKMSYE